MILKITMQSCNWSATLAADDSDPAVAKLAIYKAAIQLHKVQHADCTAMEEYLSSRCGWCWADGIPRPECAEASHFPYPPPEHAP